MEKLSLMEIMRGNWDGRVSPKKSLFPDSNIGHSRQPCPKKESLSLQGSKGVVQGFLLAFWELNSQRASAHCWNPGVNEVHNWQLQVKGKQLWTSLSCPNCLGSFHLLDAAVSGNPPGAEAFFLCCLGVLLARNRWRCGRKVSQKSCQVEFGVEPCYPAW